MLSCPFYVVTPAQGHDLTAHHAIRAVLSAIGHANRLGHHGSGPVPVTMDAHGAKHINEALRRRAVGAGRAHYNHDIERAMQHTSGLRHMLRTAAMVPHLSHSMTNHVDRSTTSTTTIHGMTVHTRATDGPELMADLERHLARNREVPQSNSGLA